MAVMVVKTVMAEKGTAEKGTAAKAAKEAKVVTEAMEAMAAMAADRAAMAVPPRKRKTWQQASTLLA